MVCLLANLFVDSFPSWSVYRVWDQFLDVSGTWESSELKSEDTLASCFLFAPTLPRKRSPRPMFFFDLFQ